MSIKNWLEKFTADEAIDVVEQPAVVQESKEKAPSVIGEVKPGRLILDGIPGYEQEKPGDDVLVSAHAGMLQADSFPVEATAEPISSSVAEPIGALSGLGYLEPGSFSGYSATRVSERVVITSEGVKIGNVLIEIDAEHIRVVASEDGRVVITAKPRVEKPRSASRRK